MPSVGETLRAARERKGLSLVGIAGETRISERYLVAIEKDQPDALPGGFFYRAFVRQYATYLDLDPAELEAQIDRIMPPPPPVPLEEFVPPENRPSVAPITGGELGGLRRRNPLGIQIGLLVLVVVACAGLYAWWDKIQKAAAGAASKPAVEQSQPQVAQQQPPPAVEQPQTPAPQPVSQNPPPEQTPATTSGNPPVEAAGHLPLQSGSQPTQAQSQPQTQAPSPVNPPLTPAPKPAAAPPVAGGRPLVLSANDKVWVSVLAEGRNVFIGVLNPGETRTVAVRDNARILVGNAGALSVTWDGKPVGPIGPKGQIRRVMLSPAGAEIVVPQKTEP